MTIPMAVKQPRKVMFRQASNIRGTLEGNNSFDHSDADACWRCSNTIFICNLTPGPNGLTMG